MRKAGSWFIYSVFCRKYCYSAELFGVLVAELLHYRLIVLPPYSVSQGGLFSVLSISLVMEVLPDRILMSKLTE